MTTRTACITSVGHYLPEGRLTNADLEKMVETSDEWIVTRTGIRERRILEPGLGCSYMASRAASECLERAGLDPAEVDAIIVATITPDFFFPATAALVQHAIGAKNAHGFDLSAACSGFVYALSVGAQMIESGRNRRVLVIGSDVMSTITDYTDRNTCVLFGDAAAAVLLEPSPEPGYGVLDFMLHLDGSGQDTLYLKGGGSRTPPTHETVDRKDHYLYQDGRAVFKVAVTEMAESSARIVEKNGLTGTDVALLIPHQANLRIIEAAARRLGIGMDRVVVNIDRYGNTTAATIPLGLYDSAVIGKRVKKGDYLVFTAFGAGYTWGSALIRWWEK